MEVDHVEYELAMQRAFDLGLLKEGDCRENAINVLSSPEGSPVPSIRTLCAITQPCTPDTGTAISVPNSPLLEGSVFPPLDPLSTFLLETVVKEEPVDDEEAPVVATKVKALKKVKEMKTHEVQIDESLASDKDDVVGQWADHFLATRGIKLLFFPAIFDAYRMAIINTGRLGWCPVYDKSAMDKFMTKEESFAFAAADEKLIGLKHYPFKLIQNMPLLYNVKNCAPEEGFEKFFAGCEIPMYKSPKACHTDAAIGSFVLFDYQYEAKLSAGKKRAYTEELAKSPPTRKKRAVGNSRN